MIDMTYEELLKVKGDKLMEKLKDEAIELNNDDDFVKLMSDEEEERLLKNSYIQEGFEQSVKKTLRGRVFSADRRILQGIHIKYRLLALQNSRTISFFPSQNKAVLFLSAALF